MKRIITMVSMVAVVGIILTLALSGSVFAGGQGSSYGESSEGTGPELQNAWGDGAGNGPGECQYQNVDAGTGECQGFSYGVTSVGTGPGLQNCWGKNAR
jgi:hypothetical protein